MKVFLSWAGEASKHIATTLYTWLPQVIYTLEPWMSTRIDKGDSWDGAISDALHQSPVAIFCLTAESLESKYLHYEAGAIANTKGSKPCTLLLGITDLDVKHPLARFQHTKFNKEDMFVLLQTINSKMKDAGERQIPEQVSVKSLDHNWPELEAASKAIPATIAATTSRPQKDLLEEILETVRTIKQTTDAGKEVQMMALEAQLAKQNELVNKALNINHISPKSSLSSIAKLKQRSSQSLLTLIAKELASGALKEYDLLYNEEFVYSELQKKYNIPGYTFDDFQLAVHAYLSASSGLDRE